jgi:hypothetical protein
MEVAPEPPLAGLGERRWSITPELEARVRAAQRRRRMDGLKATAVGVLALALGGAAALPGTYDVATVFMIIGLLLIAVGAWAWRSGSQGGDDIVAVYENGVLVPSTFESVPGISTVGGPKIFLRAEIVRAEDVRGPEGRAVVLRTAGGRGGIVSGRIGTVRMTPEETERVLDEFLRALTSLGIKTRPEEAPDLQASHESGDP